MAAGPENDVIVVCPVSISTTCSSASSTHSPSHHAAVTPGSRPWRNERSSWLRHRPMIQTSHLLLFVFLTCCLSFSSASLYIEEQMVDQPDVMSTSDLLKSSLDRLARTGTILVDPNPPPNPKAWTLATENDDLKRRDDLFGNPNAAADGKTSSSSMITTAPPSTKSSSPSSTKTSSSGLAVATTEAASPLPAPFDQGFSGNITDSCSNFMYGFLRNSTFQACLPLSMMLQSSNSFFDATKSVLHITQTLDVTCAADISVCAPLMSSLASNITNSANCASDLASQNPLIIQARLGLKAYKTLYSATCLRNPQTSSYCFADAVTNASSPTDSYIYYLPLNISLPGGSQPTCNSCLKNSMAIFSAASSDRSSSIASTYVAAAQQINVQCGPGFVNASLAAAVTSGSSAFASPSGLSSNVGVIALAMVVGSWFL